MPGERAVRGVSLPHGTRGLVVGERQAPRKHEVIVDPLAVAGEARDAPPCGCGSSFFYHYDRIDTRRSARLFRQIVVLKRYLLDVDPLVAHLPSLWFIVSLMFNEAAA